MAKCFRILSIDGGGMRGAYPAHILGLTESRLGINLLEEFNMFAGTSTGAIVAAGLVSGLSGEQLVDFYRQHGKSIFTRRPGLVNLVFGGIFAAQYSKKNLIGILRSEFGEKTLGEIDKPLLLPATDVGLGGIHVFKSKYSSEFIRDGEVPVWKAVLASCSAPTYFNPTRHYPYLLADGGLWATNPSLAAVIEAHLRLKVPLEDIRVLSLGTGSGRIRFGTSTARPWGFVTGWRNKSFIELILSLQAQTTHNYLTLLLKKEQTLRIVPDPDPVANLDDYKACDDLINVADRNFYEQSRNIKKFFEKGA